MSEAAFEEEILRKLDHLEKNIGHIMEYLAESRLSEEDKKALSEALREEKEGKLLSKKQVFG